MIVPKEKSRLTIYRSLFSIREALLILGNFAIKGPNMYQINISDIRLKKGVSINDQ